nr:hypothetical protein BaRGS_026012 [Batillaria attramentaria]
MPTESGIYTYINGIDPGNVRQEVMTINVVASCEGYTSYIPENTTATCTCNTSNIGEPGGQLYIKKNLELKYYYYYYDDDDYYYYCCCMQYIKNLELKYYYYYHYYYYHHHHHY